MLHAEFDKWVKGLGTRLRIRSIFAYTSRSLSSQDYRTAQSSSEAGRHQPQLEIVVRLLKMNLELYIVQGMVNELGKVT